MTEQDITVLVADDSTVSRMFLVHLLESDPRIRVIGAVGDGRAALDFVGKNKPDVLVMDAHMPGMDGFEATRRIMETHPLPIVICSASTSSKDIAIAFQAMEAGAIAGIEKPLGWQTEGFEAKAAYLLETVKLMSEVKVVRRTSRPRPTAPAPAFRGGAAAVRIIGIGTSTGGPPVLQTILAGLPREFPVPILVVQHIAHGFLGGMAEWLRQTSGLQVQVASYGMAPQSGHVYLAPDDMQMGVNAGGQITITREPPENGLRPAVAYLFRTLAEAYGPAAIGVMLTGMGKDGAAELKLMKDRGAFTIAQDRDSSVVHGMPGEAIALDAATHVLPADRIAAMLVSLVHRNNAHPRS